MVAILIFVFASLLVTPIITNRIDKARRDDEDFTVYPSLIKKEKVRRDENGKIVETGRLETIGGVSAFSLSPSGKWMDDNNKKVSYSAFKKQLQCAPSEPGLNMHGTISLMKEMFPVDDQVIDAACAYAENSEHCTEFWGRFDW